MRLTDVDELRRDGWVLHKMVGTILHEMPLDHPDIPTVDAEPVRHGHWVTFINSDAVECSVCGRGLFGHKTDNYCYDCGAKMDIDNT